MVDSNKFAHPTTQMKRPTGKRWDKRFDRRPAMQAIQHAVKGAWLLVTKSYMDS
jgi:hypothetical protein